MKTRVTDKILIALAGLLILTVGSALAAQLIFQQDVVSWLSQMLTDSQTRIYWILGLILLIGVGFYCMVFLFRPDGRKVKFITQKTENGELAISLKALESMVQKCLEQHKELSPETVTLENVRGTLVVRIQGSVASGISIPLTVDALQQQIKQYVTACSGIEVREIRVEVDTSGPEAENAPFAIETPASAALLNPAEDAATEAGAAAAETAAETTETKEPKEATASPEPATTAQAEASAAAAAAAAVMSEAPEVEDDRPMHQRLFSNMEEPCVMPMPPMAEMGYAEVEKEIGDAEEKTPSTDSITDTESVNTPESAID